MTTKFAPFNRISQITGVEDLVEPILCGAAKLLGCGAVVLIIFDENNRALRIRVGAEAGKMEQISAVETMMGQDLSGITAPQEAAKDSLIYRCWEENLIYESNSLLELIGSVLPIELTKSIEEIIGEHRFACVPAKTARQRFGLMLFEKEGLHPFSRQQRELQIRYAHRISKLLEDHLQGNLIHERSQNRRTRELVFQVSLVYRDGQFVGGSTNEEPDTLAHRTLERWSNAMQAELKTLFHDYETSLHEHHDLPAWERDYKLDDEGDRQLNINLFPMFMNEGAWVTCRFREFLTREEPLAQSQLIQLTLGETVSTLYVDPEYRITGCNQATEDLFGYQSGELVGQPVGLLFQEQRDVLDVLNHQFLFLSDGYFKEMAVVRHKNGRVFPVRVEALLLADEEHQVLGYMVSIREQGSDRALGDDLETTGQILRRERLATMGEMAAQLAHEIRNPLVAIGATLESLAQDVEDAEQLETVEALSSEITRMDKILKDYLSMATRNNSNYAPMNLVKVLAEAQRLLGRAHSSDGKRILVDAPETVSLVADYEGIKHALFNLMLNAIEASPRGGTVRCGVRETTQSVTVMIDDEGAGLKRSPDSLMQPFVTTKTHGTGLGLVVCNNIAKAHGGMVELRNRPEGGCRATLVLPRRMMI